MNMALGSIVGSLPSTTITVTRTSAGAYVAGVYAGGTVTTVTMPAIVAPSSPRELEALPEGERTKESITVHARSLLRTALENSTQADVITYLGKSWEVQSVDDYSAQAGYYRALATRLPL